ncbi:hypothetical protein KDL44_05485 [bacterium]|nr:hypothetical protein [bacterium]
MHPESEAQLELVLGLFGRNAELVDLQDSRQKPLEEFLSDAGVLAGHLEGQDWLGSTMLELPLRFGNQGSAWIPAAAGQTQASLKLELNPGSRTDLYYLNETETSTAHFADNRARRLRRIVRRVLREVRDAAN